jgi:hypothetical protein
MPQNSCLISTAIDWFKIATREQKMEYVKNITLFTRLSLYVNEEVTL